MKLTDEFLENLRDVRTEIYEVPEDTPFKYSVWGNLPGKYKMFRHNHVFQDKFVKRRKCLFSILKDTNGKYYFQRKLFDWDIESVEIKTIEDFKEEINRWIACKEEQKQMLTSEQNYLQQYL